MLSGPVSSQFELPIESIDQLDASFRNLNILESELAREELGIDVHGLRGGGVEVKVARMRAGILEHGGDIARRDCVIMAMSATSPRPEAASASI